MKRKDKIGILLILFSITLIITGALLANNLNNYVIVSSTICVILFINLIIYMYNSKSDKTIYNSKLNSILKTYDSILKQIDDLPNLINKNIVQVKSINSIIDEQFERKNYIYYIKEEFCCTFLLPLEEQILTYTIKTNSNDVSVIEKNIKEINAMN